MTGMVRYVPGTTPLVLDSPHSGTAYPEDFRHARALAELRQAEDTHVEKLYDFAPSLGVAWIEAFFPRSYLDANRNITEVDTTLFDEAWDGPLETAEKALVKVRLGKGLIWRCTDDGQAIYDRRLTASEVQQRIDTCWKPYHAAVEQAVSSAHARHGYSIHVNCHSMPAVAGAYSTDFPGLVHADFVIGNRDESTSSAALGRVVVDHFRALGYSVDYNHPYKGVELVRRYGDPAQHRHSIQLEINRRLYMDEATLEPAEGFDKLRGDLRALVEKLLKTDPRRI